MSSEELRSMVRLGGAGVGTWGDDLSGGGGGMLEREATLDM
jgi:hypothetical protein